MRVITEIAEIEPYLEQIRIMVDSDKDALGFLPWSAHVDQLQRGRLWIVVDAGKCCGFLMFGGRSTTLKVRQIYVNPEARGKSIGRTLIERLVTHGEDQSLLQIVARVGADLPANRFWESLGFELTKQVAGGATTGRTINIRIRELNSPSLFSALEERQEKPIQDGRWAVDAAPLLDLEAYAIDLNVFFDVTKQRVDQEASNQIMGEALRGRFRLFVTPEFEAELERESIDPDPALEFAKSLPCLESADEELLEELVSELKELVFPERSSHGRQWPQSLSDLRHLAYCINSRLTGFVTSERALLRAAPLLKERYVLDILSPLDICDSFESEPESVPMLNATQDGPVSVSEGREWGIANLLSRVTGNQGSAKSTLRNFIAPGSTRTCLTHEGAVAAAVAWRSKGRTTGDLLAVAAVDESSPVGVRENGIDHILESLLRSGEPLKTRAIDLSLLHGQDGLRRTARARGFAKTGSNSSRLVKLSVAGALTSLNWAQFSERLIELTGLKIESKIPSVKIFENTGACAYDRKGSLIGTIKLFNFETVFSPGLVLCSGRSGLMVPIQNDFAQDLLWDPNASGVQLSLLPANRPVYLEKAYFRAPQGSGVFRKGIPIVFYVSKSGGGPGEVIGWARCTYSEVVTVQQALRNLTRHGVLTNEELSEIGRDGCVHVFTFDNFNRFPSAIKFETLKAEGLTTGANLVTRQALAPKQLARVFTLAYGVTST